MLALIRKSGTFCSLGEVLSKITNLIFVCSSILIRKCDIINNVISGGENEVKKRLCKRFNEIF